MISKWTKYQDFATGPSVIFFGGTRFVLLTEVVCTILVNNGEDDVRLLAANYQSIVWRSILEANLLMDDGDDDDEDGNDDDEDYDDGGDDDDDGDDDNEDDLRPLAGNYQSIVWRTRRGSGLERQGHPQLPDSV